MAIKILIKELPASCGAYIIGIPEYALIATERTPHECIAKAKEALSGEITNGVRVEIYADRSHFDLKPDLIQVINACGDDKWTR